MGSEKRNIVWEFISFNIVGIINTVLTYLLYSLLIYLGVNYRIALVCDYCCGTGVSFVLNRRFTFHTSDDSIVKSMTKMVVVYVLCFSINLLLLTMFIEKMKLNHYIGQLVALGITVIISFFGQKYIVFRNLG